MRWIAREEARIAARKAGLLKSTAPHAATSWSCDSCPAQDQRPITMLLQCFLILKDVLFYGVSCGLVASNLRNHSSKCSMSYYQRLKRDMLESRGYMVESRHQLRRKCPVNKPVYTPHVARSKGFKIRESSLGFTATLQKIFSLDEQFGD